jgi:2-succinyl-6-hydroxy-2,4-cyclohexadiene-1-carboxylate synthase
VKELVLFHGFLGGPDHFDDVVAKLPAELRVLRPTLPGHGPFGEETAHGTFAQAVETLADSVPRGAVLAGYSLGARLALAVAARRDDLGGLVSISGSAGLASADERAARRRLDEARAAEIERGGIRAFADDWGNEPVVQLKAASAEVGRRRAEARRAHTGAGIAWSLRALGLGSMPPLQAVLARLAASYPVHFVVGELDLKYRSLVGDLTAGLAVSVHVVPTSGHDVVLDAPADLAAIFRVACDVRDVRPEKKEP